MDRSRSKRYHHDHDYDHIEPLPRTKPRYINNNYSAGGHHYSTNNHHRRRTTGGDGGGGRKPQDPSSLMVTTSYRILCHDAKAGSVIGKSGSIIKAIRQHTGAWINVHELMAGDEERIIEISDTRRRNPDGRTPLFSPAQEALLLTQERILESDGGGHSSRYTGGDDDDDRYAPRGVFPTDKVLTRLVVSKMHTGCLLGKGGKIIEQMRMETKSHIRVLPRDQTLLHCVSFSEEIVQIAGEISSVKNALSIISSRLRESQHRDCTHFHGWQFPPDGSISHRPRSPVGFNNDRNINNAQSLSGQDLVFRILCPNNKIDCIIGQSNGIAEFLLNEIGVKVKVSDLMVDSDEQIIIVSSEEGRDDELFPAQEALLHIQSRIVDFVPEKQNIITTRLLLSASEIGCLEGRDKFLSETEKLIGANIQILPREQLPGFISVNDELVQIVGEIKTAREALVEVTSRLRSYVFQHFFQNSDSRMNRIVGPLVTRSVLEVVVPQYAVRKLITKSRNKLAQISELSGANLKLIDDVLEATELIIRIYGTRDQAQRAQSLLQGFILSTQEDGP